MDVKIRKANKSDSDALLHLLEEARKYKLSLGDSAWGDFPFTADDAMLRIKSGNCYVAESNGVVVGSIMLLWEDVHNWGELGKDGQAGYIHGLLVGNKFRGQGLGEQMIEWAIDQARKKKRPYLRLDCPVNNSGLCTYYEKLGFQRVNASATAAFYEKNSLKS